MPNRISNNFVVDRVSINPDTNKLDFDVIDRIEYEDRLLPWFNNVGSLDYWFFNLLKDSEAYIGFEVLGDIKKDLVKEIILFDGNPTMFNFHNLLFLIFGEYFTIIKDDGGEIILDIPDEIIDIIDNIIYLDESGTDNIILGDGSGDNIAYVEPNINFNIVRLNFLYNFVASGIKLTVNIIPFNNYMIKYNITRTRAI